MARVARGSGVWGSGVWGSVISGVSVMSITTYEPTGSAVHPTNR